VVDDLPSALQMAFPISQLLAAAAAADMAVPVTVVAAAEPLVSTVADQAGKVELKLQAVHVVLQRAVTALQALLIWVVEAMMKAAAAVAAGSAVVAAAITAVAAAVQAT
jgi:hypothetical protein